MDEQHSIGIEEQILKESIVSAAGLNADSLQIGLKGDPSMRETVLQRKRYRSALDEVIDTVAANLEDMMLNRGIYCVYAGFNSGEIRTLSIFDPLRSEIHAGEKLADRHYIERQFPTITLEDKVSMMKELYEALRATSFYKDLPGYWQSILKRRSETWQPLSREDISAVFASLKVLRELQQYYLRNITVCMVQGFVRMQFNCDGTQIINARNLERFISENLP
ncbi:MAG: hypothetical protein OEY45_07590 [Gammaproteobacteria bacterium]|nr:hypothetical protein [Gammaproteobacteria bacterium]MDH5515006.1 hypothetical protein [Gammaproteobacteria bacterium]